MSTILGHLNNVVPFSVVDGPGSRFVIFMQGCNFDCIACHNPYTITACDDCGVCVDLCPEDALDVTPETGVHVDRMSCTDCDICIDVCPNNSTPLASWVSVDDLITHIRTVAPLIRGITVSGGEATLQPNFLVSLFRSMRTDPALSHLSILVDSNGSAAQETWDRLMPLIDGVMIDLKALDVDTHRLLTARDNDLVLASIQHLFAFSKLAEVRVLAMPGYNTDQSSGDATAEWLGLHAPGVPIKLIAFRHQGVRSEGLHVPEPTPDQMVQLGSIFEHGSGNDVIIV